MYVTHTNRSHLKANGDMTFQNVFDMFHKIVIIDLHGNQMLEYQLEQTIYHIARNNKRYPHIDLDHIFSITFYVPIKKYIREMDYYEFSTLKPTLINRDVQTWHLTFSWHNRQPIKSHVRKNLLTNINFSMDFI